MPLTISNSVAQKSVVSLNKGQKALETTLQHLATGKKINASGDNASGMVVSNALKSNIRQGLAAQQNISTIQAMLNTVDSVVTVASNYLDRLAELTVMGQGPALDTNATNAISAEASAIVNNITSNLSGQKFNGTNLADGTLSASYAVGASAVSTTIALNLSGAGGVNFTATSSTIGACLAGLNFTNASTSSTSQTNVQGAVAQLGVMVGLIGKYQQDISSRQDFIGGFIESLQAAQSAIVDADLAQEAADFTKNNVIVNGASSMLSKANSLQQENVNKLLQNL